MRRLNRGMGGVCVRTAAIALFALGGAAALAQPAREENPPAEFRILPYSGLTPYCVDPTILDQIVKDFAAREAWYWNSPLVITAFDRVREYGVRNNGLSYIPRRYCRALALFNDGVSREVVYNIGEGLGFIGAGPGVTWCVVGLDRNHAFSPMCRAAGP
ncbi:MAG: hypothetical protein AB7F41_01350 [Methylocystis sp.]|uniref:hypothetical protein n=1 Tax=Methylocystis sp. TaxID=1911079 RepID=UPI003D1098E1